MKYYLIIILFGLVSESCKVKPAQGSASNQPKKKSAEWYYQQGVLEAKSTNSYVAINNFTKAIGKKKNYYDAYFERANTYIAIDSIGRAVQDYDSLLSMKSLNQDKLAKLYYLKGNALYLGSKDSLACACWRKAKDFGHNDSWNQIRKHCK